MPALTLVFDLLVIVMLGATIFYAVRLNKHLSIFRSNRSEMERLIRELSTQITRAQEGISELDDMSTTKGEDLRRMVSKAQGMCDELSLMTEAGDSLAGRLEKLAEKNREIADNIGQKVVSSVYPGQKSPSSTNSSASSSAQAVKSKYEEMLPKGDKQRVVPSLEPSFAIRDPDYDESMDEEDLDDADPFLSKAERDLAAALKNRGSGRK
ncbi:MAG: hypothetical protein AUJ12_02670 [Alphaproteobacteria bacterium CG1_02_46_17]|nr:MAG: hypothetical protein AUJ12_02670 [Alphaproteobacteria bacterium CG1_02_46_17]